MRQSIEVGGGVSSRLKIGFDFDGTLAVWPAGVQVRYDDADWSLPRAAAVLATVKWLKQLIAQDHDVVVVTGRGENHVSPLRYWLHEFTGHWLPVVARPDHVGLSCQAQAAWKASVLQELAVCVYVGDNPQIDKAAARLARVRFLDAARFLAGELPPLPARAPL